MSNNIEDIKIVEERVETLNRHIKNYEKIDCKTEVYQGLIKERSSLENLLNELKKYRETEVSYFLNFYFEYKEGKFIHKNKIREKINERQFELQQEYKDFKDDIRLKTLQEIYYMFEGKKDD